MALDSAERPDLGVNGSFARELIRQTRWPQSRSGQQLSAMPSIILVK